MLVSDSTRWRILSPRAARSAFLVSALPTLVTVGLEWGGVWRGTNTVQAIAGIALGVGGGLVVMSAVATLNAHASDDGRSRQPDATAYLIGAAAWLVPGLGPLVARTPSERHRLPRRADRDVCVRALARGRSFRFSSPNRWSLWARLPMWALACRASSHGRRAPAPVRSSRSRMSTATRS